VTPDQLRQHCDRPLDHPAPEELRRFTELTIDWILRYDAGLSQQPVGRSIDRQTLEKALREPPPWQGSAFESVLATFERDVASCAYPANHPRFLAFIPGAPTFLSVLGDFLCASTNFFAGVWCEAAGPAQVELVVLDWFRTLLGLPAGTDGLLTGGGSEANLTALVVARERLPVSERGRAVLYVSEQRHWSVDRAARIIGVLPHQVRPIAVDADLRLRPNELARLVCADRQDGLLPWAVVANAGSTNTGAVDPLVEVADLCEREGLFLHVDAAFGWAACLTEDGRRLLKGIERADSITLDPHKWLAQTFEVGGLLVRRGEELTRAFAMTPEYMQDVLPGPEEVNFADRGIALSRRFRALKVWLSIKVLGLDWFARLVEHSRALGRYAQAVLTEAGFEILSPEQLATVCFRHAPAGMTAEALDRHNLALIDAVRVSGEAFLSSTRLHGRVAIRLCLINWRTSADDIDCVVSVLRRLATSAAQRSRQN
jgi:glutamate/tyrosine decarboxylase-like PLP-dependent enzyme